MFQIEVRKKFKDVDSLGRPDWNLHWQAMTYFIANRSFDTSTKCGCVVVRDNLLISSGFNGPPAGSIDNRVPINIRPDKYWYMEHAERNAIYNAAKIGLALNDVIFYVTGIPCYDCMRGMLCLKPKAIICAISTSTVMNHYQITVSNKKDKSIDYDAVDNWLCINATYTKIIEYRGEAVLFTILGYLNDIHHNTCSKMLLGT